MRKIGVLFFIFTMLFVGVSGCLAENSITKSGGYSITPFLKNIELSDSHPEETFSIELKNNSVFPVNIKLSVADFGSMDASEGLLFVDPKNKPNGKYSLAPWVNLENNSLSLESGESKDINVRVFDNANLSPGGHYGAIIADVESSSGDGVEKVSNIQMVSKMTSLIFLRKIGGDIFGIDLRKQEKENNGIVSLPEKIRLSFANTGNVHIIPRGLITIIDPLGREISRGIINNESKIILPESSRIFPVDLFSTSVSFLPGRYRIETQYRYDGKDDFAATDEKFLFFPPIANFFVLMILSLGVYLLLKRIRLKEILGTSMNKGAAYLRYLRLKYIKSKQSKCSKKAISSKKLPEGRSMLLAISERWGRYSQKLVNYFRTNRKNPKKHSSKSKNQLRKEIIWTPGEFANGKTAKSSQITKVAKKNKKIPPNYSIWTVAAIVFIGAMLLFYLYSTYFQGPVSGEIKINPNVKNSNVANPLERFEAINLSFHHSPSYKVNFYETNIKEDERILERALLSESGSVPRKIAITVENMSQQNLTDVADYNLRKKYPKKYVESKFDFGNISGITFSLREGNVYEKTNFILHDDKLIELSFSTAIDDEIVIGKEAEDVIKSIQWKN